MSGKRNVSVCKGHELANALYITLIRRTSGWWGLIRDNGSSRASQYVMRSSKKSYIAKDTEIAR